MKRAEKMSRQELKAAIKSLESKGYVHVYTVMSDDNTGHNYGMFFLNGSKEFWLNKDTYTKA
jgi:hypothetical protein